MKKILLIILITFTYTYTDLEALQRVVYAEARGESDEGKLAVAYVVVNRHNKSGKTIEYEATKKSQFNVWEGEMKEKEAAKKCKTKAQAAIDGSEEDPSNGATFFCTLDINPDWAEGKETCAEIGNHKFFKDIAPYN